MESIAACVDRSLQTAGVHDSKRCEEQRSRCRHLSEKYGLLYRCCYNHRSTVIAETLSPDIRPSHVSYTLKRVVSALRFAFLLWRLRGKQGSRHSTVITLGVPALDSPMANTIACYGAHVSTHWPAGLSHGGGDSICACRPADLAKHVIPIMGGRCSGLACEWGTSSIETDTSETNQGAMLARVSG